MVALGIVTLVLTPNTIELQKEEKHDATVYGSYVPNVAVPVSLAQEVATTSEFAINVIPPEPDENSNVLHLLDYYAYIYKVDFNLAKELIKIESTYCEMLDNATSSAKGCFQFIDATWAEKCVGDPYNHKDNISCAMKILGTEENGIQHWIVDGNVRRRLEKAGILVKL